MSPGTHGTLRLMQDVRVERADTGEITVLAANRPVSREQTIQLRDGAGRRVALRVNPVSSAVVPIGEILRHRVSLQVIGSEEGRTTGSPGAVPAMTTGVIAVLVRRIPARAVNMSSTGCFLEVGEQVTEGSVALLDMLGVQRGSGDVVRLCRTAPMPGGAWPWGAGAEFLSVDAPLPTSIRNVAARLEALMESPALAGTRDKSGSDQTTEREVLDLADAIESTNWLARLTIEDRTS